MKNILLSAFLLSSILFSCNIKTENDADKQSSDSNILQTKELSNENLLITDKSVGDFRLGDKLPEAGQNGEYTITIEKKSEFEEGQEYIYSVRKVSKGTELLFFIKNGDGEVSEIQDVEIFSERFKTEKGIGVNSTIEELITQYPDIKFWGTYIAEGIWADRNGQQLQFNFKPKDCKANVTTDSDITEFKKSDFKKGAKITSVRIYKF